MLPAGRDKTIALGGIVPEQSLSEANRRFSSN